MSLEIKVGISARHLHISQEHLNILFGEGSELHPIKELMGGQFAADERVTVVGAQGRKLDNVRILGPIRKATQVEVSATDAMFLKVAAPLRDSGDVEGTAAVTLIGPKGQVELEQGCIVAKRHIHMSPADAERFGVADKELVSIDFPGERRGTLHDVLVRVDPTFTLEMHLDTDEANALAVKQGQMVVYNA
ncbi:MAG: phosphate propanoyltransferase [Cellulosilyticaceae bacterium]